MKHLFTLLFIASAFSALQAQQIEFDHTTHDFGKIDYAGNGKCNFIYTNTGEKPLLILKAKGSCGCTIPSFSRSPLMPGQTDTIVVAYDTKRPGSFMKKVYVHTNSVEGEIIPNNTTEKRTTLKIKGKVGAKVEPGENLTQSKAESMMAPLDK